MYSKPIRGVASRKAGARMAPMRWLRPFALALAVAVLLAAMIKFQPRATTVSSRMVAPVAQSALLSQSPRRIYPYSVIPGGAYNAAELRTAAQQDSLIRAHYRDFDLDRTRLVVLRQNRHQYVSYRMAGQIFWTKERLLIPKGELLLTDGSHFARTRCGNRLSNMPRRETSDVEPAPAALNPVPDGAESVQASGSPPAAHVASQPGHASHPPPDAHERSLVVLGANTSGSISRGSGPAPQIGSSLLFSPPVYISTPTLTPVIQPDGQGSAATSTNVLTTTPADPAIVPEPGTLYLFGFTGIASLCALIWLGRPRRQ